MNLKDFLATRDKPPELLWSLVLEKGWVQAGIWYIGAEAAEVLAISPPAAWSEEDELVGATDAALSSAVAKLSEDFDEPNKTVFGVPSAWVKGGEIQDEFLAQIKKICNDLSLSPVGFVVLPEAIAHLFKSEDGSPLSAVIVGLGATELEVSVFKLGNLVGTTTVARSVSVVDDVTEGLNRFEGATPLPSRIILYDGKGGELEDAKEELVKTDWAEVGKVKFLHTPKVEILVSDRKVLATSLAGAAEIGNISKVTSQEPAPLQIEEEKLPPREEVENIALPEDLTTAEELGFVMDEDISANNTNSTKMGVPEENPTPAIKKPDYPVAGKVVEDVEVRHPEIRKTTPKEYLQKTKNIFHGFSSKIKIQGPKFEGTRTRKPLIGVLILLVLLVVGGIAYLWFVPKATVTVYVSPKTYQEQVNITFNADGIFDESRAVVPATLVTSSATGDKTKSTSGTKLVGEKAVGSVQIANGNGNPIHLSAGTVLTSTGGLKFLTSAEASVSGQLIPGSPGTATLAVTAADIGAQYNLAKGEIFKVGLFDKSQVAATSQADFSGGSSQQIAAVSDADLKSLEADLKTELSGQVLDEISGKVTEGQIFVNDLAGVTVSAQSYDHKVGDVASTLKLSLTVNATGVAADKAKLLQYTSDLLKSKIPQGFALRSSQVAFKFKYAGGTGGNQTYTTDISANFLPMVNTDELASKIQGKSARVVEEYLSSVPGYTRAEVRLKPNLPGPLSALPRIKKHINIEVASDR